MKTLKEKVSASPEHKYLDQVMDVEYATAVTEMQEKATTLGITSSLWEIRYFATSDCDEDSGKHMATLELSKRHPEDSNETEDICSI